MRSPRKISLSALLAIAALVSHTFAVTEIATFSDEHCQDSYRIIKGPNGYPNGTCTSLESKGNFSSFQVVHLDYKCGVTIYGPDTTSDPCSATTLELAEKAKCYGATWKYYSIDNCVVPHSSPVYTIHSQSLSQTTSAHSTISTGSRGESTENLSDAGIIGISVGTAVGLIILAVITAYVIWQRRRAKLEGRQRPSAPPAAVAEPNGASVKEKDASVPVQEMHSHSAWEMDGKQGQFEGRGVVSELPGVDMEGDQAKKPS